MIGVLSLTTYQSTFKLTKTEHEPVQGPGEEYYYNTSRKVPDHRYKTHIAAMTSLKDVNTNQLEDKEKF